MAKAAAEDVRQADSAALYPPQPAYRQASVMDLLNRPQSSGSRPSGNATHPPAYASRRAPDNQHHMLQPQTAGQPWIRAELAEGSAVGGMPIIHGGLALDLAGQSPDRSRLPFPAHIEADAHLAELRPDQPSAGDMSPNALQPQVQGSPGDQQEFPAIAATSYATGTEADQHAGIYANVMDGDQSAVSAGYPDAQPVQGGLSESDMGGIDRAGGKETADEAAQAGQQGHNQLAEIDAATWAKLPANVQACILAGEAVNLEAALHASEAASFAPQVLLHISPIFSRHPKRGQTRWRLPSH